MEIYKKLAAARAFIKASPIKKAGWNKYSEYWYYTPEQINALVHEAEIDNGLIHLFNLEREPLGLVGRLTIINIDDPNEVLIFIQATDIPAIKATNISQQIGGAVTYTNRYMLMTAYDISDNSLDFDAKDNREPEKKVQPTVKNTTVPETAKLKIGDKAFAQLCERLKANPVPTDRGNLLAKTRKYYLPFTDEQENVIKQITDNL